MNRSADDYGCLDYCMFMNWPVACAASEQNIALKERKLSKRDAYFRDILL